MFEIEQTENYRRWFAKPRDEHAKSRVDVRIERVRSGNFGDARPVGNGVSELRTDCGPGYRVYLMRKGKIVVVLLAGGDKADAIARYSIGARTGGRDQGRKMIKTRRKVRTYRWDPARHIKTEKDVVAYLDAALEDGDPAIIAAMLGDIARSRGMTEIAKKAGVGRESLYKALSKKGNPGLATLLKVVHALGYRLTVTEQAA